MVGTRHVFETYIRSTPDKVWEALTDPAFTRQFFFGLAVNAGWEPGGAYSYDNAQGPALEGTIEEIDPPRRLARHLAGEGGARSGGWGGGRWLGRH